MSRTFKKKEILSPKRLTYWCGLGISCQVVLTLWLQPDGTILHVWISSMNPGSWSKPQQPFAPQSKELLCFSPLLSSLLLTLSTSLFLRPYHSELTLLHCPNPPQHTRPPHPPPQPLPSSCLIFCYLNSHCMDGSDHPLQYN